jgi:hypothetical protein
MLPSFRFKEIFFLRVLKSKKRNLLKGFQILLFFFTSTSTFAVKPAIELPPGDIVLMKTITQRTYEDTAYARNSQASPRQVVEDIGGIRWTKQFFSTTTPSASCIGGVYFSSNPRALVVAFHGSHWFEDWLADLNVQQTPATNPVRQGGATNLTSQMTGNIHQGFASLVNNSYTNMLQEVTSLLGRGIRATDEIYFVGHSLGGALAMLAGAKLAFDQNLLPHHIKIVTFSTPRGVIGDEVFVNCVHEKLGVENILSFSTQFDVVPYLPQHLVRPLFSYASLGTQIEITPSEKVVGHYLQPLRSLSPDDVWEHPARSVAQKILNGEIEWKFLLKEGVLTFHAIPSDECVEEAFLFAQDKYRNTTRRTENVGSVSFFSAQRNPIFRFFYNII